MVVTFCGHDFEKEEISRVDIQLHDIISKLISDGHNCFIISGNSMFDRLAIRNLLILKPQYPHIRVCKICAEETTTPYDILYNKVRKVKSPKSLADYICRKRAVDEADVVVCYIKNTSSTEKKSLDYAIKQEKDIVRVI